MLGNEIIKWDGDGLQVHFSFHEVPHSLVMASQLQVGALVNLYLTLFVCLFVYFRKYLLFYFLTAEEQVSYSFLPLVP